MQTHDESELLAWCTCVLGSVEVLSDHSREHPDNRTGAHRLRTDAGLCYLKTHNDPTHWHNEVHGYPDVGRMRPACWPCATKHHWP